MGEMVENVMLVSASYGINKLRDPETSLTSVSPWFRVTKNELRHSLSGESGMVRGLFEIGAWNLFGACNLVFRI